MNAVETDINRRLRVAIRELLREMERAKEAGWGYPPYLIQAQQHVEHLLALS